MPNLTLRFVFAICLSVCTGSLLRAEISPELKDRLTAEVQHIGTLYRDYYAPKSWKEKHVQWNLDNELKLATDSIKASNSVREYRQAFARFFISLQDYHVGYSFQSTESATLPLFLRTVQGKTIIVDIDRTKLSEAAFPFNIGDEVLEMDGKAVSEIKAELMKDLKTTAPKTDSSIIDLRLTGRSGRRNMVVPQNTVLLKILKNGESTPTTHQLNWEYNPELLPGLEKLRTENFALDPFAPNAAAKNTFAKIQMIAPEAKDFSETGSVYGIGERKPFLPSLGDRLWETDEKNTFDAYIYKNEKGQLIGVIRIPNYTPGESDPVGGSAKAVADFAQIITKMQKLTAGLIIDEMNNPGGSVFYLYSLASMLTNQSLYTPKHRMMVSYDNMRECLDITKKLNKVTNDEEARKALGETAEGYPVSYQFALAVKNYCQFFMSEYKLGKRITDPFYIYGIDQINPSPTARYTKPVVVLINELDFSGGDFFPAILQDNKRVTVVGTRTSGAGGYILDMTFPTLAGLERFTVTGSIAERIDRNPIENLGVTPDVEVPLTLEDYRSGYAPFLTKVKSVLSDKIDAK